MAIINVGIVLTLMINDRHQLVVCRSETDSYGNRGYEFYGMGAVLIPLLSIASALVGRCHRSHYDPGYPCGTK